MTPRGAARLAGADPLVGRGRDGHHPHAGGGGEIAFLTGHAPFVGALDIGVTRILPTDGGELGRGRPRRLRGGLATTRCRSCPTWPSWPTDIDVGPGPGRPRPGAGRLAGRGRGRRGRGGRPPGPGPPRRRPAPVLRAGPCRDGQAHLPPRRRGEPGHHARHGHPQAQALARGACLRWSGGDRCAGAVGPAGHRPCSSINAEQRQLADALVASRRLLAMDIRPDPVGSGRPSVVVDNGIAVPGGDRDRDGECMLGRTTGHFLGPAPRTRRRVRARRRVRRPDLP